MQAFRLVRPSVLLLCAFFLTSGLPAADSLPPNLKGPWNIEDPLAKRQQAGEWSVHINKITDAGAFEGTVSFDGRTCHGTDLPMKGTYTGTDMTIEITQLGGCGASVGTLHKGGGQHLFEGGMSHNPKIRCYLDPN